MHRPSLNSGQIVRFPRNVLKFIDTITMFQVLCNVRLNCQTDIDISQYCDSCKRLVGILFVGLDLLFYFMLFFCLVYTFVNSVLIGMCVFKYMIRTRYQCFSDNSEI